MGRMATESSQANLPAIDDSRTWPAGLWKLLTEGENNAQGAARLIAINPTLRAQLEARMALLEESKRPAEPGQIMLSLAKNGMVLGIPDRSPEAWAIIGEPYLEALKDVPLAALEEGWKRWHRGEVFPGAPEVHAYFPKPAQLVMACKPVMLLLGKARNRARLALEHVERAPSPPPSPEERARIAEQMRAEGFLTEDGKIRLPTRRPGAAPGPRGETPQQMAARLRAAAAADPAASEDVI